MNDEGSEMHVFGGGLAPGFGEDTVKGRIRGGGLCDVYFGGGHESSLSTDQGECPTLSGDKIMDGSCLSDFITAFCSFSMPCLLP